MTTKVSPSIRRASASKPKASQPPAENQNDDHYGDRKQSKDTGIAPVPLIENWDDKLADRNWSRQTQAEQHFRISCVAPFRVPDH